LVDTLDATVDLNLDPSGAGDELSLIPQEDGEVDLFELPESDRPSLSPAAVANRTGQYKFLLPDEAEEDIKGKVERREEESLQNRIKQENVVSTGIAQKEVVEAAVNFPGVTPQDVQSLAQRPPEKTPEDAFKDKLANTLASFVFTQNPDGPAGDFAEPLDVDEKDVVSSLDIVGNQAKRTLTLQRLSEEHQAKVSDQQGFGFDSATTDFLEQLVPGLARWRINDIDNSPYPTRFLLGNSKADQRLFLLTLPPKEFAEAVKGAYSELAEGNLAMAGDFLSSIAAADGVNQNFDNAGAVLDVVDVVPIRLAGKLAVKAGRRIIVGKTAANVGAKKTPAKVADDIASTIADPDSKIEDILTVAGNEDAAAKIKVETRLDRLVEIAGGDDKLGRVKDMLDSIPAYASPVPFNRAPSVDQAAQANRLIPIIQRMQNAGLDATLGGNRASRSTPIVSDALFQAAKTEMKKLYDMPDNAVKDITPDFSAATGTRLMNIKIGKVTGDAFATPQSADNTAKRIYHLDRSNYTVETVGERSHIIVTKDVPERLEDAWDALKIDTLNQTPGSIKKVAAGMFFGAANFASKQNRKNFAAVSHMSERAIENLALEFQATGISRKEWKRVSEIFDYGASRVDADGRQGKFFTLNELYDEYAKHFNRAPSDAEAEAYYKIVTLSNTDLVLRNFKLSREMISQGIQEVKMPGKSDEWFDARPVTRLPKREDSYKVVEYNTATGKGVVHTREALTDGPLKEALDNGEYHIQQLVSPTARKEDGTRVARSLTGNDDAVEFILTKQPMETRSINFKQVVENPGGHQKYKHNEYVKQVRTHTESDGRKILDEDYTIANVRSTQEGEFFSKWLNAAQKAYNDKDFTSFKKIVDEHLPYSPDELRTKFKNGTFSTETPFAFAEAGTRIVDEVNINGVSLDSLGRGVFDPRRTSSLSDELNKKFLGQRDMRLDKFTYNGSERKPDLTPRGAEVINAARAIDEGFSQVAREFAFGDAEISAVRGWLTEYGPALKNTKQEILQNPMKVFQKPDFIETGDNFALNSLARANHRHIQRFLGRRQTLTSRAIDGVNQQIAKLDFNTRGSALNAIIPSWQIPVTNDPFSLFRASAYHLNLGFWNPYQAWLQAQGIAVVAAVNPKQSFNAGAATKIGNTLFASNLNPAHVKHADDMIVKLSKTTPGLDFKPGEFKQGFDFLEKTGWRVIGREVGNLDDAFTQTVVSRAGSKLLQSGRTPFNWGERWTRQMAYWASYKQWLKENPGKAFDKQAQGDVLVRADDYALNMTRQGNANWQEGFASTVTQFSSFHIRLMEAYAGKRFTTAQKTRLAAVHMALYGVGPGVAGAVGIPYIVGAAGANLAGAESTLNLETDFKELLRSYNLPADNAAVKFATQGTLGLLVEAATGSRTSIGSQSGPGGLPLLEEVIGGEVDLTDIFGPGGKEIGNLLKSAADPLWAATMSVVDDRPVPDAIRVLKGLSRNISTTNNVLNGLMALKHMELRSQTDGRILAENLSTPESIMLMFGIKPDRANEQFELYAVDKIKQKHKRAARKEIAKLVRLSWQASSKEERNKLLDEAWFKMESWFQPHERYRVYTRILKEEVGVDALTKARLKRIQEDDLDPEVFPEN